MSCIIASGWKEPEYRYHASKAKILSNYTVLYVAIAIIAILNILTSQAVFWSSPISPFCHCIYLPNTEMVAWEARLLWLMAA